MSDVISVGTITCLRYEDGSYQWHATSETGDGPEDKDMGALLDGGITLAIGCLKGEAVAVKRSTAEGIEKILSRAMAFSRLMKLPAWDGQADLEKILWDLRGHLASADLQAMLAYPDRKGAHAGD